MVRAAKNRLILARDRALRSGLRARILPDGSTQFRIARRVWGNTIGRIAFLRV